MANDGRKRRIRPAAGLLAGAVLLVSSVACGQSASSHARLADAGASFWGAAPATAASPNGENTTPTDPTITYQYTVTTRTKVTVPAKGAAQAMTVDNPLQVCPVAGRGYFSDDFGAPRHAGGFHHHAGNDVFALMGTPVLAPFDGRAVATPNSLGGLAVTVYGVHGYVYNAHLVRYGKLGAVRAGEVVGYVGNTGDAIGGAPHDHFEWHPYGRPPFEWRSPYGFHSVDTAVDPYPYLKAACT